MNNLMGGGSIRRVEVVSVEDDGEIQKVTVKGLADEEFDLSLRAQPHGLTGNPTVGAVGQVLLADGNPDTAHLLNLENPDDRPKSLKSGESKMYATAGQSIHMDEDGNIVEEAKKDHIVKSPDGIVHINPPE